MSHDSCLTLKNPPVLITVYLSSGWEYWHVINFMNFRTFIKGLSMLTDSLDNT